MNKISNLKKEIVNYCSYKKGAPFALTVTSLVVGILGILASQGLLGQRISDLVKKIPDNMGGKNFVLGVGTGLVAISSGSFLVIYRKKATQERSTQHIQIQSSREQTEVVVPAPSSPRSAVPSLTSTPQTNPTPPPSVVLPAPSSPRLVGSTPNDPSAAAQQTPQPGTPEPGAIPPAASPGSAVQTLNDPPAAAQQTPQPGTPEPGGAIPPAASPNQAVQQNTPQAQTDAPPPQQMSETNQANTPQPAAFPQPTPRPEVGASDRTQPHPSSNKQHKLNPWEEPIVANSKTESSPSLSKRFQNFGNVSKKKVESILAKMFD